MVLQNSLVPANRVIAERHGAVPTPIVGAVYLLHAHICCKAGIVFVK